MQETVGDTGSIQRLMRAEETRKASGCRSVQQLYNLIAEGRFPKPIKIGQRAVAWIETEVIEWQKKCIADRDTRLAEKAKKKAAAQG